MNKDSIFFKLNILFIVAFVATTIASFLLFGYIKGRIKAQEVYKTKILLKEFRQFRNIDKDTFKILEAKDIKGIKKKEILLKGKRVKFIKKRDIKLIKILYQNKRYYLIGNRDKTYLVLFKKKDSFWILFIIYLIIELFLVLLYLLIRKNLMPLKQLDKAIKAYANGKNLEPKYIDSNDEVAKINNTFYNYAIKAQELSHSRELFIKNIFHELNTPVTKGKLLAELSSGKQKEILESIFNRLSKLLKELSSIEKITSKNYKLDIKKVAIKDLIESAKELLYLKDLKHNFTDEVIYCDFDSMCLVFKNLIDNGLKYGSEFKIEMIDKKICFISKSQKLEEDLDYYIKPFVSTNRESMGLGLYITNEILKMHSAKLNYFHKNGFNYFCIDGLKT